MGLFGGSSNDTSSGLDFSGANSSNYGSKLRSSGSELDLSDFDSSGSASGSAAGDLQMSLQREQQKALLMSAVSCETFLQVISAQFKIFVFNLDS